MRIKGLKERIMILPDNIVKQATKKAHKFDVFIEFEENQLLYITLFNLSLVIRISPIILLQTESTSFPAFCIPFNDKYWFIANH